MTNTTSPAELLSPPPPLAEVPTNQAANMVPLNAEAQTRIDQQVQHLVAALQQADLGTEAFKQQLDTSFQLGRQEIAAAAALSGRFMERNFVGAETNPAFQAIQQLRNLFDELNPAKAGNLLAPHKWLGLFSFGNKMQAYFRKFERAGSQIRQLMANLYSAQDELRKDAIQIEHNERELWTSMQKLRAAAYFAEQLDTQLTRQIEQLRQPHPLKAQVLEQEVLFYARQSLTDILSQQTINVNAYLSMGILKKTARDLILGCERMATHGISALSVATTIAQATGNQINVMHMLQGASASIGHLINSSSVALGQHVEQSQAYTANPTLALEQLQQAFDTTFKAIDNFDNFRAQAMTTMGKNNALLRDILARGEQYLEHQQTNSGPVAL